MTISAKSTLAIIGLLNLMSAGCAKFPETGVNTFTKRLILTMRVSGEVQSGQNVGKQYIYVFPLRVSTDINPSDGPKPVISGVSGNGNGMISGACTDFILYNPQSSNAFEIWHFQDSTLTAATLVGYAISRSDPRDGAAPSLLQCELDLSQIVPATDVPTIQSVQCNFMSMDRKALNGISHVWDSLGNSRLATEFNTFLRFDLNSSRKITNSQAQLEPQTLDVNGSDDPDLDISDWSVEVLLQQ